ncbi:glycoside hydrolase [Martensiomyces pterosporus]|nr:glycoside hydrolase [Martensiomyces pterosporus]
MPRSLVSPQSHTSHTVLSSGVLSNTVVVGYTYESGIDPSIIPWGSLTHLVLAFFSVDQSGNVVPGSNTSPQSIVDLAHKNDVKVIASIGGSGDGSTVLAQVLSSNTTCTHMAADLANKIKEYNLDGVDFDLEFPNTAQQIQDLYVALKGTRFALDAAFGARNKTLTMTLYSSKGLLGPSAPQTDAKPFSDVVDYGLLMAYDFFGSWAEISAPNSPFYDVPGYPGLSFTSSIAAWLKSGWDPKKLVAGLPYYGRTAIVSATTAGAKTQFMPNSGAASPGGPVSKITGAWTWTDLRDPKDGALKTPQEAQQGWQRNWDSTTETPWLLHNDSQTYIGYDDLDSLAIKANHIITSGLVGAMVWMVNYDYKGELGSVVANYTAAYSSHVKPCLNECCIQHLSSAV